MQETLITFETAKLAKKKGYKNHDCKQYDTLGLKPVKGFVMNPFPAPTQSLLQKWLREVHNIYVTATPEINRYNYPKVYISESRNPKLKMFYWSHYRKIRHEDGKIYVKDIDFMGWFNGYKKFKTYEEALEFGLQEALKLIKQ